MKTKFNTLSILFLALLLGTACDRGTDPKQVTHSVNSGSDNLAVFVYDGNYRDANKCVPDKIRRIPARNGVYEFTTWGMPGSPVGLFIVHTNDGGDIGKVVISSDGIIVHRSETNKANSLSFTGTIGYNIERAESRSKSICENPLMQSFSEKY